MRCAANVGYEFSFMSNAVHHSIATYGCENWTLRKNEERRLIDAAFEMKGLRKIVPVSWTTKKTNEWVLNKAGVRKELLKTVEAKHTTVTP